MEDDEAIATQHIHVLPDTCVELFINYTHTPLAIIDNKLHHQSIITARMNRATTVQMRKGAGCLAICFYPGMAYPFFKTPMQALSNTTVALTAIWGQMAVTLADQLSGLPNHETRALKVQQYLIQQLAASQMDLQVSYCLNQIQQSGGTVTVHKLTTALGLSQRQLSRKFQENVGLSPKAYLKVSRFVQSLQLLKRYPQRSLTTIAYQSGYYDQAHFIHDYKTYTGHLPSEVANAAHIFY